MIQQSHPWLPMPSLLHGFFICRTLLLAFLLYVGIRARSSCLMCGLFCLSRASAVILFPRKQDCAYSFILSWLKCHHLKRPPLTTLFKIANSYSGSRLLFLFLPLLLHFPFKIEIKLWPITTIVNLMFLFLSLPTTNPSEHNIHKGKCLCVLCLLLHSQHSIWGTGGSQ